MTQEDLERLINDKRIVNEVFDDAQVAGFWSKAVAAFADARVRGISADTSGWEVRWMSDPTCTASSRLHSSGRPLGQAPARPVKPY